MKMITNHQMIILMLEKDSIIEKSMSCKPEFENLGTKAYIKYTHKKKPNIESRFDFCDFEFKTKQKHTNQWE